MSAQPLFAVNEFSTVVVGVLGVLVLVLALGPPQNPEHDHSPPPKRRRGGRGATLPYPSQAEEKRRKEESRILSFAARDCTSAMG